MAELYHLNNSDIFCLVFRQQFLHSWDGTQNFTPQLEWHTSDCVHCQKWQADMMDVLVFGMDVGVVN